MDFELKHLDMIQGEGQTRRHNDVHSDDMTASPFANNAATIKSSLVLEELTGQVEELQNKLKVSYRKLLLYESENQKLIQEKNSLFFENKVFAEHNEILTEKNKKILTYNEELEADNEKKSHKIDIAEKLMATQKADLGRLSKFHLKVKNIIKPYVENLKQQNANLTEETTNKTNVIAQLETYQADLTVRLERAQNEARFQAEDLEETIQKNLQNYAAEKTSLIQSYEEQIHFLSKEIVEQQQKTMDASNENLRLKKQCETKHFVENELVKYKRAQDEQIQITNTLRLREADLQRHLTETQLSESNQKTQVISLQAENENAQQLLQATRRQLSLKITEVEDLSLRLKMLEKLNSNLSLSLKDSQNQ